MRLLSVALYFKLKRNSKTHVLHIRSIRKIISFHLLELHASEHRENTNAAFCQCHDLAIVKNLHVSQSLTILHLHPCENPQSEIL